jgi:hypothetical protein
MRTHEQTGYANDTYGDARIENAGSDFYRQMDPHGLVLSQGETASPRGAAPAPGVYLAAHAYENSSPSRILRLDCTPGDEI